MASKATSRRRVRDGAASRRSKAKSVSSAGRASTATRLFKAQTDLLKAGLAALPGKRARHAPHALGKLFKPLEEVFDQRVAAALKRLGAPTSVQFRQLSEQIDRLTAQVVQLRRRISRKPR